MISDHLYIGLMSGTSIDAVDAVAVTFNSNGIELIHSHSEPIPQDLKQQILDLCHPHKDSVQLLGETDHRLGRLYAKTSLSLLDKAQLKASQITAIGCHGQTIRHAAPSEGNIPFSLQIGDANILATETGIPVVADFRRKDMALGGQGAPLVPAFHHYAFADAKINRVIVNIGGISNISILPIDGACGGFDTGPGNVLMDLWSQTHLGTSYDHNGDWAASGETHQALLQQMKRCDFFSQSAPKSTGRELFNQHWLNSQLTRFSELAPQDIQATLLSLTADSISEAILELDIPVNEVYICGGGAYNNALMVKLSKQLPKVMTTEPLGIAPSLVEGCAFAWLAKQRLNHQCGNLAEVTGAKRQTILGAIYLP
ncbi:MAG: anhydro-N-acetylmuramic acid kinase [Porticoccaceae bacterium]|nr:anhydro-N-acetylmuramic acid kinase [Porticoccaceae bacterium]